MIFFLTMNSLQKNEYSNRNKLTTYKNETKCKLLGKFVIHFGFISITL